MGVIAAVALAFLMFQALTRNPVKVPVKAAPYVWTEACPEAEYKRDDQIPGGCAREEYRIADPEDYPIQGGSLHRSFPYYRVGNEIVDLICPSWGPDQQCVVHHFVKNAFYQ
jgi:hypothetical protein